MAKRERGRHAALYAAEEGRALIKANMKRAGTGNFSVCARKALCGICTNVIGYSALRELSMHLGEMARNTRQIAKRANQPGPKGQRL